MMQKISANEILPSDFGIERSCVPCGFCCCLHLSYILCDRGSLNNEDIWEDEILVLEYSTVPTYHDDILFQNYFKSTKNFQDKSNESKIVSVQNQMLPDIGVGDDAVGDEISSIWVQTSIEYEENEDYLNSPAVSPAPSMEDVKCIELKRIPDFASDDGGSTIPIPPMTTETSDESDLSREKN